MNYEKVPFTLGYEALTLLGKGMYSNLWSALAELIANGIDAHAQNVYVYIDMSDKKHSIIEILDDGDGMSYNDIKNKYVVIGANKRKNAEDSNTLMGRKGVGKLAALFLTKKYEFLTAQEGVSATVWQFDFSNRENPTPMLVPLSDDFFILRNIFDKKNKGTLLKLFDVNLTNMAEEAINALSLIMANYFLYDNLPKVNVNFYIKSNKNDVINYDNPLVMRKQVAFNNMMALISDDKFNKPANQSYNIPLLYADIFDDQYLIKRRIDADFSSIPETAGEFSATDINGNLIKIPYELRGWIGIHSSIDMKESQNNDLRFVKNRFYNPNKLRLYIRNKLAVEDFLGYIKNTQQGVNYIEGEISFDLLDDDNLEDITTSNRQDIDIHDPRVSLLINIVKKLVTKLIGYRNGITKEVSQENNNRKKIIENTAKKNAQKAIKTDLSGMGISDKQTKEIIVAVSNKFKGTNDPGAKEIYKLFISHSRKDQRFSDFLYNLLKIKGAKESDIFYTSHEVIGNSNLSDNIKANISEFNVLVLFLDSVHSIRSQYCMFEGGAFWATRSVNDCIHLHFDTSWIPDYINDTKKYHVPLNMGKNLSHETFILTPKKYNETISILNIIINHLNNSSIHTINKIKLFEHIEFPNEIELERNNKSNNTKLTMVDYMDKDLVDCWNTYVVDGKTDIINGKYKSQDDFIKEYNETVKKTVD